MELSSSEIPLPTTLQGVTRPWRPAAVALSRLKLAWPPGMGKEEERRMRGKKEGQLKNSWDTSALPHHQPRSTAPYPDGLDVTGNSHKNLIFTPQGPHHILPGMNGIYSND